MGGTHRKFVENDTNLEIYSLIWLDSLIINNEDLVKVQQRLRTSIHYSKIFDQLDQCEEYIRSLNSNDRVILVIDDSRARQLIPRIEQLRQVSSIYIHASNKNMIEQWAEQFLKIKIVTDQFSILINHIESSHKIDDLLSIVISTNKTQFHFSQFLFNSLFELPSNTTIEFLNLCKLYYKDNSNELNNIQDFEQNYSSKQVFTWYKRKSFIYRILVKAFRIQNIEILFMLRFFLRDMFEQIKQDPCSYAVRVYRSHLMTIDELQLIQNSVGQMISINSFLSASFDRGLALFHLLYESNDLERVLFEIDAEPSMFATVLSSEQILFMFGSIFQIENLSFDDNDIWIIRLKLSSNFSHYQTNLFTFGQLIIEQNDFSQAEKYYRRLLNEYPCEQNDRIHCYESLGRITKCQRNYDQSIEWFNKALQVDNSIEIYNNLGEIYQLKNDFKQAIAFYNKSLNLFVEQFGDNHPKLVHCLNNIAIVYKEEKNYSQALDYHLKALAILDKSSTKNQSDLAISYNNIGVIYRHLKEYDLALKYFELALKTYENSSDSGLAKTYRNLGFVYEDKRDYKQALIYFRKSVACHRNFISSRHPTILAIEEKIQSISCRLK